MKISNPLTRKKHPTTQNQLCNEKQTTRIPIIKNKKTIQKQVIALTESRRVLFCNSETLGHGTYCKVKVGHLLRNNNKIIKPIAIKKFKLEQKKIASHEKYIYDIINKSSFWYIAPKCYDLVLCKEGTSDIEIVMKKPIRLILEKVTPANHKIYSLQPMEKLSFFYDIANCIKNLHTLGIIWNDLKLENMLIDEKNTGKISDFGISFETTNTSDQENAILGGTYYPKEVIEDNIKDPEKLDIWAFGHELARIFYNAPRISENLSKSLYMGRKQSNIHDTYLENIKEILAKKSEPFPLKEIVLGCLHNDPTKRWKITEVIEKLDLIINQTN